MSNVRFFQIEIGQQFTLVNGENTSLFTKVNKSIAGIGEDGPLYPVNSQTLVNVIEDEVSLDELIETDFHTFDFTPKQLEEVVSRIVQRAADTYGADRIDAERLRKGVLRAHATNPIRLIALLHACNVDFPADVVYGIYRHYDVATDSIRGGWVAQHAEPHTVSIWEILFETLGD